MFELIAANWFAFLVALLVGIGTGWWVWARNRIEADVVTPKIEPSAPKAVADLAREMPVATEPVALMGTAKAAPKAAAKPAAKTKAAVPKAKAAPAKKAEIAKPKAETAPKAKAAAKTAAVPKPKAATKLKADMAPNAKAEPAKKAATPKAKTEAVTAPKAKAAPVAKAKAPEPKTVAKPKAAPKPKLAAKPVIPNNLELLKGVGPKLNTLLKSLGITSFEQVANWTAADIREIDAKLGNFAGRITRDNWIDQAKLLSAGDVKAFEKKYGALGSEIQKG